jgi:hypothetical protein
MKTDSTYIAVVLDRSGSMSSVKQATIDGFNEFVNKQKQVPGECRLMLTQFDDVYEMVFNRPIAEVQPLDDQSYHPRGMTALHDAIGKTIHDVGKTLAAMPEADRPARVLVAIITDGGENSSKEFHQKQIADLVQQQQDQYSWIFVFIGANQDAVLTAKTFNIPATQALTYSGTGPATSGTIGATFSRVAASVADPQSTTLNWAFTKQERELAQQ